MPEHLFSKTEVHASVITHFKLGESAAMYMTNTIRNFGISLIGIFVPIYIFQLPNLPVIIIDPIINSFFWIIVFYLILSLTVTTFCSFITNTIFGKINFKGSIFISTLFCISHIILLGLAKYYFPFLFLSAFLLGFEVLLYWIPYHILFIRKIGDEQGHYGKSFSKRLALIKLSSAFAPFIGGIIITKYSYDLLFMFSIFIVVISSLPIVLSIQETQHGKHNAVNIFREFIKYKYFRYDSIAMIAENIEAIMFTIFSSVLLYISLESYVKIGFLNVLSIFPILLITLYTGKLIDQHGRRRIHKIGVSVNSLLYIPRALTQIPFIIASVDILDKINSIFYGIPFNSAIYEHAKKSQQESDLVIYREIIRYGAASIFLPFVVLLLLILPNWQWIFFIIGLIAPLTYLVNIHIKVAEKTGK